MDDLPKEREKLLELRREIGELETETKPFDPIENIKIMKVYSSIANAGSGEFHTFRKLSAKEHERLRTYI